MKNNLLFLTGLFLIFLSCSASNENSRGWKEYNLTGKVKSIRVQEFSAVEKFGELVPDEISKYGDNYYVEFLEDGGVLKGAIYSSLDTLYYDYSNSDKVTEKRIKESKNKEKILYIKPNKDTTVLYNTLENRNIVEQRYIFNGLLQSVTKMEYENNLLHKYYIYDKDGKLEFTSENIYDKKKLIAHIDCSYWSLQDDDKISVHTYYLDEKGDIIKEEMSDSTRNRQSELQKITDYTYEYDDAGNWIRRIGNSQDYFHYGDEVDIDYEKTITTREIEYF